MKILTKDKPTEQAYYQEKNGKRRKAEWVICENCGVWFAGKNGNRSRFCSNACLQIYTKQTTEEIIKCDNCNINFVASKSNIRKRLAKNKTSLLFCSRKCKEMAQVSGKYPEIRPEHWNGIPGKYRQIALNSLEVKCVECNIKNPIFLQVHHIDGDRTNREVANLEILCSTHHQTRHLRKIDGEWRIDSSSLTPRELLTEVLELIK